MYNAGPVKSFLAGEDIIGGQVVILDTTAGAIPTPTVIPYDGSSNAIGLAATDSFAGSVGVIPFGNRTYELYVGYGGCEFGDELAYDTDLGAWVVAGSGDTSLAVALQDGAAGGKIECIRI